ncbi:MAG: cytochrome b N-terminal domain-containing protein [Dehalococcoidia bacterium]
MSSLWRWIDHRLGVSSHVVPVLEHRVPRDVNWWYVLGSATLTAFALQVVTGVALAFTYVPSPDSAHASLQFISSEATLGHIVRGIHYWGASAMVVLIAAHAVRVFLMGAFKFPRELNWLTGVGLLVLTLGMAFTGQVLRWDQDAYWSTVVMAAQTARVPVIGDLLSQLVLAGKTVGGTTLTRFYATHVFLMPALIFGLFGVHLFLVLRHGISEPPRSGHPVEPDRYEAEYEAEMQRSGVPFWPTAAWRDVVAAAAVVAVVVGLAAAVGPRVLGAPADPTNLQADPRPDWYFLWLFAILALLPANLEDWVIVGLPTVGILVLVLLPIVAPRGERSPARRPWAVASIGVVGLAIGALIWEGQQAPWSPVLPPPQLAASTLAGLDGQAAQGAHAFEAHACSACHTIDGVGGHRGPDLSDIGARLTTAEMASRILNGAGNMPAFADSLTPEEVNALLAFLETRGGSASPSGGGG